MPNLLKLKRGAAASIPTGQLAEPLFTSDTYDLYIGTGSGNQRFQKYIASGTSSEFLKGDGTLDNTSYQTALTFSSPLVNTSGTISIPAATGSVNGYLTSTDWTTFNSKEPAITAGTTLQYYRGDKTFQTLDTAAVPENGAIYFTEPRVRATVLTGLNLSGGGTIAATDSVLTAFGKLQNQISAVGTGVTYIGTWDASTNTPTITSGTGTKGYYYVVNVAGSTNIDGITDWNVGDWIIFNGTVWDQVDNTDAVSSVNGFTGAVNLALDNISDVSAASPTNAQLLRFNGTSSLWENWTPTFEPALTKGNLTEATSSVLTITGGTGAVIGSGTTIQVAQASGSTSGYLSSTDWTTFNNKQNALTNPVTGTGTANQIAYWTSSSAIGSLSTATYPSLTELSYVKGVTSAIQTQIDGKQASSTNLTSLAALTYASTSFVKMTASGTFALDTNTYLTTSSASSTYLPLTGGTLTGALSGTSATFSDLSLQSANYDIIKWQKTSGTASNVFSLSADSTGCYIQDVTNTKTLLYLTENTGAATFSSSVRSNTYFQARLDGSATIESGAAFEWANTAGNRAWVQQLGASNELFYSYYNGTSWSSPLVTILNGGNVGIGTNVPASLLTIAGSSATEVRALILRNGNGTVSSTVTLDFETSVGTIGDIASLAGRISGIRTGSGTSGALAFSTTDAGVLYQRMIITSGGNVGIGTSSPSSQTLLHLKDNTNGYVGLRLEGSGTYAGSDWIMYASSVSPSSADDFLGFYNNSSTDSATVGYKMAITKSGNVGIGTSSPQRKLHVLNSSVGGSYYGQIIIEENAEAALQIKGRDYSSIYFSDAAEPYEAAIVYNHSTNNLELRGSGNVADLIITSGGEVWIGYTADQGAYALQVNGAVQAASGFFDTSDIRLKNVLNTIESSNISAINYTWKDGRNNKKHWGYAAQDVMKVLPDAVEGSEDKFYTVNYNEVHTWKIAMLEQEIKELKAKLN